MGTDRCEVGTDAVGRPSATVIAWRKQRPSSTRAPSAARSPGRWLGRCPGCGAFGTMVDETLPARGPAACPRLPRQRPLLRLVDVVAEESERIPTGVDELDRVLGGGLVPRVARARRRRARRRQVDAAPDRARRDLASRGARCSSRARSRSAQVKLRAARLGGCDEVEILAETELDARLRDARARAARRLRDRLGADALRRRSSARRPGRSRRCARRRRRLLRVAKETGVADVPRRPRDQGRRGRRARACSSTSSTACCSSRATATTRTASCARSRTASARPTSSASSR